jgi:hypothetical protein
MVVDEWDRSGGLGPAAPLSNLSPHVWKRMRRCGRGADSRGKVTGTVIAPTTTRDETER